MRAPLVTTPQPSSLTTPQLLLQGISRLVCFPPTGVSRTPLAPWILWHLWKARNLLLFEDRLLSAEEVLQKAITEARLWQDAQLSGPLPRHHSPTTVPPSIEPDTHVCYVDAAWNPVTSVCGLGWILKDPNGSVILQASSTRPFTSSALIAEALAIRSALNQVTSLAHLSSIRSLRICSDSQVLIKLLKTNGSQKELKGILHDICCLKASFSSISFSFTPRLNNVEADSLAKSALLLVTNSSNVGE